MKIKKGGGKYLLIALISGSVTGAICLAIGLPPVAANAIPFGVSCGVFFTTKDKWLA